jgi:type II secretory pathway component PulF
MPNFKYRAVNSEGRMIESVLLGRDSGDVMTQLRELGMVVINVTEIKSKKRTDQFNLKIKDVTILHFTKQLYTLLKAGLPIVSSLRAVKEQTSDENFKEVVESISHDIEQGSTLSSALGRFPKVFPPIFVNSIKVGEVSGTLEETLNYIYRFIEDDSRMRKEVKKALRYPVFVTIGLIGAFIVFTTMVIPNFIPMFQAQKMELPLPTRILIGMHYAIMHYGILIVFAISGLIAGVWFYIRTPNGRLQFDQLMLSLPVIGDFVNKVNLSRFSKLFYTMNRTGLNITNTFSIMQETMENAVYRRELSLVSERIIRGQEIANSLKQSKYFSPLLIEMISIGEKSGSLDDMLNNVSEYYSHEVSDTVANLTSLIEPVITIGLGGMILLLALAMFLPMWDMMKMF